MVGSWSRTTGSGVWPSSCVAADGERGRGRRSCWSVATESADRVEGAGSKTWLEKDGWGHRRWLDARRWETSGGRCWVATEDGDGARRRWLRSVRVLLVGVEIGVAWRLMDRGRRLVRGHGRWIGCGRKWVSSDLSSPVLEGRLDRADLVGKMMMELDGSSFAGGRIWLEGASNGLREAVGRGRRCEGAGAEDGLMARRMHRCRTATVGGAGEDDDGAPYWCSVFRRAFLSKATTILSKVTVTLSMVNNIAVQANISPVLWNNDVV
ncbi:hypothetical protein ACLOJK_005513 [Asimina triloba]